ncbi:MAG: aminoglycoside phosphotransferase family protein [Candidatus Hodarchaeota archaeon]
MTLERIFNKFGINVLNKEIIRDRARKIYKIITDSGEVLILKKVETPNRAEREFNNLKKAHELLTPQRVPKVKGVFESYILLEYIDGKKLPKDNENLMKKSLDYLACLHSRKHDNYPYENHYFGKELLNRLEQEKTYFYKTSFFSQFEENFLKILERARQAAKDREYKVIGHGDFQIGNILVDQNLKIVPIDWIDFGFVLRWYDLGTLLYWQSRENFKELVEYYLKLIRFKTTFLEAIMAKCLATTFVIQTGSHFRAVVESRTNFVREVKNHFEYIDREFPELFK